MDPLFVTPGVTGTALDALKAKLRLTGVPESRDVFALILEAVRIVRSGFYKALGGSRVAVLVALPHADSPSTTNEVLRATAEIAEVKWCRLELLRTLPMLFIETAGTTQQQWNEEGLTRNSSDLDRQKEIARLRIDVDKALEELGGVETDGYGVRAVTIGPSPAPALVGSSPFGVLGGYWPC